MEIKLSIIIITWNGLTLLRNCLISLSDILRRKDVEVVIIDNGSQDGTLEFIKEKYPNIKLTELSDNKGVSYARNRGLEQVKGEYILILDNDTIVTTEAIEGMEHFMDSHQNIGICGCKLIDADGLIQESCKRYPGIGEKMANILHSGEYRYSYGRECMSVPFEPEYLIGACQFIRKKAFNTIGLLDENIFYGPEDADFCLRIKKAGWKIVYLPQFSIIHYCQRATNKKLFSKLAIKHMVALFYFYLKHKRLF